MGAGSVAEKIAAGVVRTLATEGAPAASAGAAIAQQVAPAGHWLKTAAEGAAALRRPAVTAKAVLPEVAVAARAPSVDRLTQLYQEGKWSELVTEYTAATMRGESVPSVLQEQFIVGLNKTKQYSRALHEVRAYIARNPSQRVQQPTLVDLDPLNEQLRNHGSINGEVLAVAGKAFRELGAKTTLTVDERAAIQSFLGSTDVTPGALTREAMALSTKFYEAAFFADRSYYGAINAAHNNLRMGNTARAERFSWMAQASLKSGGHGSDDYWSAATRLEAAILTRDQHEVPDLFEKAAKLASGPWTVETTAQTLADTLSAMRKATGVGADETMVGDTVTAALRAIAQDRSLAQNQGWLASRVAELRQLVGAGQQAGDLAGKTAPLPSRFADVSNRIVASTVDKEWRHQTANLDRLYRQAPAANRELRELTRKVASDTGGEAVFPPPQPGNPLGLKGRPRAEQRVADFAGDASQLTDIVRSSISFGTVEQLYAALGAIAKEANIVGIKDRFAAPMASGYRDVLLKIRAKNGHVTELQLHLKSILDVKNSAQGHSLYEAQRNIWSLAEKESRSITADEAATIKALNAQMRQAYDTSYAQALGAR